MDRLKLDILRCGHEQSLRALLSTYEFSDYRTCRILNKEKLREYLFSQIKSQAKKEGNWLLTAESKGQMMGLAALSFLPWDTRHFGINMAKIDYLMAKGDYDQSSIIKNKLLSCLFKICRDSKIQHLSGRIDIEDISSIHILEEGGFRHMDTLVTYLFNRYKHKIPDIKDLFRVRDFKKSDLSSLIKIAKGAFSKDRFHLDAHISNIKADELFGEWVKNCIKGAYADKVFVAEKHRQPVGFLTFKLNKEMERFTGYKIAGRGLSAVLPQIKGAYPGLVKAALKEIILHYDCLEFDTQLNNYEVIKIWQRFGFDFIRVKYTLHKWL